MTRYYNNENYNAAFERCVDLIANLMIKHGPKILEQQRQKILEEINKPDFQDAFCKDKLVNRLCGYCRCYEIIILEKAA